MSIEINAFDKGLFDENTYIVKNNNECIVIDPGYFGQDVKECIGDCKLSYILITHSHQDHVADIDKFIESYPDAQIVSVNYRSDITVTDGMTLDFAGIKMQFITTPGHSIDGMCVLIEDKLFSGDTLFYMSVGATHFPGGNFDALSSSIANKLFKLDEATSVFPGHGPATSIAFEKRHNPFV